MKSISRSINNHLEQRDELFSNAEREAASESAMSGLREELTIAHLAAQIAAERKDGELQSVHAALAASKRAALRRLEGRWERMLLVLAWRAAFWPPDHHRARGDCYRPFRVWCAARPLGAGAARPPCDRQ